MRALDASGCRGRSCLLLSTHPIIESAPPTCVLESNMGQVILNKTDLVNEQEKAHVIQRIKCLKPASDLDLAAAEHRGLTHIWKRNP
eukprot:scaffold234523_cov21-Tisochrysis_lutea.AAC.1